jgi:hypothetical protein
MMQDGTELANQPTAIIVNKPGADPAVISLVNEIMSIRA